MFGACNEILSIIKLSFNNYITGVSWTRQIYSKNASGSDNGSRSTSLNTVECR